MDVDSNGCACGDSVSAGDESPCVLSKSSENRLACTSEAGAGAAKPRNCSRDSWLLPLNGDVGPAAAGSAGAATTGVPEDDVELIVAALLLSKSSPGLVLEDVKLNCVT